MDITRRKFLKNLGLIFALSLFPIGLNGWAGGLNDLLAAPNRRKRLIVLFQRGAVDGLSVVVPYGDATYYDVRPTIAIPENGTDRLLDLDGYFGLHPALDPVVPMWKDKSLAFIHACGSPDPSRSHFDAQALMECGTVGSANTNGWMNRLLSVLPGPHAATAAISMSTLMPRIFKGPADVASFPLSKNATAPLATDRPLIGSAFDELYSGNDPLSQAYRQGQLSRKQLMNNLKEHVMQADNGAPSPSAFAQNTDRLAQLLVNDPGIQLVFLDLGGWDTHINQGSSKGQLANRLKPLAEGLASLRRGLGDLYHDTAIIIISEFGRTVHENGDGGTDHGHGNVMWVMGGGVEGGKIYGQWPGLAPAQLYEERDLAVTTDYRHAIGSVLKQHLQLTDEQLLTVFPDMPSWPGNVLEFSAAH